MTHVCADRLQVTAAWLDTLPVPEPYGVHKYIGQDPMVSWHCTPDGALKILATIGGDWRVSTYDEPQTIATRDVEHLETKIHVTVVVAGVNLPDLATRPRLQAVGAGSEHRYHYPRQAGDPR